MFWTILIFCLILHLLGVIRGDTLSSVLTLLLVIFLIGLIL